VVIDTSALIGILLDEPEAGRLIDAILASERRWVAAPTLVEATAVARVRKGSTAVVALDALYRELGLEVVAMTAEAGRIAADAYLRYGKGVGDPAVLNYGDCLVYGVAMQRGETLLFKGDDFGRTDVPVAAW
jgi:ribonuclease VapC